MTPVQIFRILITPPPASVRTSTLCKLHRSVRQGGRKSAFPAIFTHWKQRAGLVAKKEDRSR